MENIHPIFDRLLTQKDKEQFLNQKAKVLWFTGLSGSGKSTIAENLEKQLFSKGYFVQVLDGDNTRTGINKNLGFSLEDRLENIRRVAEISKLFINSGIICINSFVSPTIEIRNLAKEIIGPENFIEVFINTPLEVCEARDVKGLYKKARAGEIKGFTGIDSPFEAPENPEVEILTADQTVEDSVNDVYTKIINHISLS
ncbi:MAG: adenylyl-sulfate kinase [Saprospiraceae bacterium]|nr:adenylyl-sulfate kinase [Bacteroidia bacterium]NNE13434.1 adenylyl-sulfate kinase [Saprospiraceae bacterium]NNL93803.1 adenylyl-sulfate kinase [Saprospiraceae bacterium]